MPELPDVEVFRKEAKKALNKKITDVEVIEDTILELPTKKLVETLKGNQFTSDERCGKYLFLNFDDSTLVIHFGMTGYLEYHQKKQKPPKQSKVIIIFEGNNYLHYVNTRKLGKIDLTGSIKNYLKENNIGKDALDFNKKEFIQYLEDSKKMVKTALTEQSSISGIGNIYADEILFHSKIHPKTNTKKLKKKDFERIYQAMQEVVKAAIDSNAQPAEMPGDFLIPHRDDGEPCPVCEGHIEKIKISGRSTYFCLGCQEE